MTMTEQRTDVQNERPTAATASAWATWGSDGGAAAAEQHQSARATNGGSTASTASSSNDRRLCELQQQPEQRRTAAAIGKRESLRKRTREGGKQQLQRRGCTSGRWSFNGRAASSIVGASNGAEGLQQQVRRGDDGAGSSGPR